MPERLSTEKERSMHKCKITVLKTTFNKELVDQFVEKEPRKTPCP
jgi:hypothetical protein